ASDLRAFSILLRARESREPGVPPLRALAVTVDRDAGELRVEQVGAEIETLAQAPLSWPSDLPQAITIQLTAKRLRVAVGERELTVDGLLPSGAGGVGLALDGGRLEFTRFDVRGRGFERSGLAPQTDPSRLAFESLPLAYESLALVLFNSNEFLWVD
ncbi:MAG: hypothetical protein AAFZ65_14510, partial [Planctomycetota bacterium]